MKDTINFPNLHIQLDHVGQGITIGGFTIHYYGIIIALGMIAGVSIVWWMAKKTGQKPDDYLDLALYAIVGAIIGARLYYVAFRWSSYRDNLWKIFQIREGGLAIYGGVIAGAVITGIYCKVKKKNAGMVCDTAVLGLVLGQAIGRWGNFFNREVFGGYTDNLFAMQLPVSRVRAEDITAELNQHILYLGEDHTPFIQVHPTFLYESLWNVCLLVFLLWFTGKKKFHGQIFLLYLFGYGVGRFWIEAIRTDQLKIPYLNVPVSMVVAAVMILGSAIAMAIGLRAKKKRA